MKRLCLPFLICVLMSVPVSMGAKGGGDVAAGGAIYQKTCKACHGPTGQGNPAMVKASKGAMQDLTSPEVQGRTDEQLAKDIAGGTPAKKAIKPLSEKEMKDAIAYVRSLAKK